MKHALTLLLRFACLTILLGMSGFVRAAEPVTPRRPNILFLMDDQHRGDWQRAAGAKWMITPNLDRLAHEGVLFRRAYTSAPSCLPARAALLTGMSPWGHGCLGYISVPERYVFEKPRVFTEAGWSTCVIGKNHFSPPRNGHGYETILLGGDAGNGQPDDPTDYGQWFRQQVPGRSSIEGSRGGNDQKGGVIYPFDEKLHLSCWTADKAVEFLENYKDAKPWFLKVSFIRPHAPFQPLQRWIDRYAKAKIPGPAVSDWARQEYGSIKTSFTEDGNATRGVVPDDEIRSARLSYAASVSHVDEQIGRVLAALEKRGELENTLILFTADHGDMLGDNLLYRKTFPYEGSVRVPMIVRWPASLGLKARRGQVRDELAELRDVLPTFLDAAALPKPASVEGMSLLDILRGKPGRQVLDLEHASCYAPKDGWLALMDQRYKYIYFEHTGKQQLFDLAHDPHELRNLVDDPKSGKLVKQWREKMVQHLSVRGEPWVRNSDLAVLDKPIRRRADNPNVKQ